MKKNTTTRMNQAILLAAAGLALLAGVAPASADILYNQPSDADGGIASQNDTGGGSLSAKTYDNFIIGSGGTVTDVSWEGDYFNPKVQGVITAFTLTFYADSAGQPGSLLLTNSISGNANETSLGLDNAGSPGNPYFSYSTSLPTSFTAAAGTQYWLAIVPDLNFEEYSQWGWETSTGSPGDGVNYQYFDGTYEENQYGPFDLAFELSGSAIPEPTSLCMLGLGAAGLLARRRKAPHA